MRFLLRQVYRILVIFPYTLFLEFFWLFKIKDKAAAGGYQHCFIITSLIYCQQKKLTYAPTRSVYSAEQRYEQTIATINSVRQQVPGAHIVCVEAGLEENPFELSKKVDTYLYVGNDSLVRKAVDSPFKSLGEVSMLLRAKKIFPVAGRYFKISGRYFLNETFKLSDWDKGQIVYHYIRPDYISTRLYSFTAQAKVLWEKAMWKGLPYLFLDYPVEHILARFTPREKVTSINVVGISGADATSGKSLKE